MDVAKATRPKGASAADPVRLFNSNLKGKVRRALDFHEGDKTKEVALKALICVAVTRYRGTYPCAAQRVARPTLAVQCQARIRNT